MSADLIMQKLANQHLGLPPALRDVMQRVREQGLHKTAGYMYGVPEITLKEAATIIGVKLAHMQAKHARVQRGLHKLALLEAAGDISISPQTSKTAGVPNGNSFFSVKSANALKRTFAMAPAAAEKHLRKVTTHARRTGVADADTITRLKKHYSTLKPLPVRDAQLGVVKDLPMAAQSVAKRKPTQAIDQLATPRHLASTNPNMAIDAGQRFGAPVMGTSDILDQLGKMDFESLGGVRTASANGGYILKQAIADYYAPRRAINQKHMQQRAQIPDAIQSTVNSMSGSQNKAVAGAGKALNAVGTVGNIFGGLQGVTT